MRVREAQNLGALMILVASLVVYGGSLLIDRYPLPETSLPWGNQGPGMIAAEVTGSKGADGVYFLPESMTIATILKVIGYGRKDRACRRIFIRRYRLYHLRRRWNAENKRHANRQAACSGAAD